MARNFSDSPKEYKKLRCYSKNDNPFYIRHNTFIMNSGIEVTDDSSANVEQPFKIQEINKIAQRNATMMDEQGNKFDSERESEFKESFIISEHNEKHKQKQQGKHDIEEIISETKITTNEENQNKSEENANDSATKLEEGNSELIENSCMFSQEQEKHQDEQYKIELDENEIWEKEITTNHKFRVDQSNVQLKVEDLEQIEREANNSEKQEQLEHQNIEHMICETKITTDRENWFKSEGEKETGNICTNLKSGNFEQIEEGLLISKMEKYNAETQLETKTTINNKPEPEQTTENDSLTKVEVKDLEQIKEIILVGQTKEKRSNKQESFELQDNEDIIWETEVTTNSVMFENGLEIEKRQNNEINNKVFEFSSVLDQDHDSDEYKDREEEEYKSVSLLKIEGSQFKNMFKEEVSDGVNQGLDKLVGETSFGCLLEIERDKGKHSRTDDLKSDLHENIRIQGILDIEKMNDVSVSENESFSSEDEGFHELSLSINVEDKGTKENPLINTLLETMCGDIVSLVPFDSSNIDEDQIEQSQPESKESMMDTKETKFKFNCTFELESNIEEEQECQKKKYRKELLSCKEEFSQEETNVQNKIDANDNSSHLKQIDERYNLKNYHVDTKEYGKEDAKDTFDISDNEELLIFEQLFEQLSSCPEHDISREEQTNGCVFSVGNGKEVSEKKFEPETISNIEAKEDIIPCFKDTKISLEGFNIVSFPSSSLSLQFPHINAGDNFEKGKNVHSILDQAVHQENETTVDQGVLIIDKFQNEMEGISNPFKEPSTSDISFETRSSDEWMLAVHRSNEANTKRKSLLEEIAYKVAESQTRTEDIFTDVEALAFWKLDAERRAKAKMENKAFIEEIAYKVAESQKRTEDIFTSVEALALWKLEAERRAKAKMESEAFIEEIAYKVGQSQTRINQIFNEIESFVIWKLNIVNKDEMNYKRETECSAIEGRKEDAKKDKTIREITKSVANSQANECNMKNKEKETTTPDQETKVAEHKKDEGICFIFKEEAELLQSQLFPKNNNQMKTYILTDASGKYNEKKELFEQARLEEVQEGNDISFDKGKDDTEEIAVMQTNDTQNDCSKDGKYNPGNNDALGNISTKPDQLSEEASLDQQVTCLLPILSLLWFICLLLKLFQDEIKLQQEQEKKSSDYKYFDILEWP